MGTIKDLSVIVILIFVIIVLITSEELRKKINKLLNKPIGKTKIFVKDIVLALLIVGCCLFSYKILLSIKEHIVYLKEDFSQEIINLENNQELANEQLQEYYKLMKNEKTNLEKCKNPYIPDGFHYIEGEWNTGFVIEDENKNQFVWIPCTNIDNDDNIPILEKRIFATDNKNYFNCYEQEDFEKFIISALENGGFYIGRFEVGNEEDVPVIRSNVPIWNNINYDEAQKIANSMYPNINSKLPNGYAIDTALSFIFDEIMLDDIDEGTGIAGQNVHKNIYDLTDNMFEWTSEMRYKNNIMRGSIKTEYAIEGQECEALYFVDRFGIERDFIGENLGFRIIIYK